MDGASRGLDKRISGNNIGERLRALREKQGISQRELARRAQLTNGTLSNIEQGRVSPSICSLEKILGAFRMSLQEFFSGESERLPFIYREEQLVHIHKNDTVYRILPLGERGQGGSYLAMQSYAPGAKVSSEWMVHQGNVAGFVTSGQLHLTLDGVEFSLDPGEGFNFSIHRPHVFKNAGAAVCTVVCVSLGPVNTH